MRRIEGFIWLTWVAGKLWRKHRIEPEEVEEAFFNSPYRLRRTYEGRYLLYGRSEHGRYLLVVFVWEGPQVKVISARDMTASERSYYGRK